MTDYSMDDEAWTKRTTKVNTYLESHDIGDMEQVIRWNLNQGDTDPDNRKRFWTSITTLFGMLPDSPISRGRESDLPENIQQAITGFSVAYADAYAAAYATDPLFGEIVRKHGKSGGGVFADTEAYHASLKGQMKGKITGYYRNSLKGNVELPCWDGTVDDGVPVITQEISDDDSSEEEE